MKTDSKINQEIYLFIGLGAVYIILAKIAINFQSFFAGFFYIIPLELILLTLAYFIQLKIRVVNFKPLFQVVLFYFLFLFGSLVFVEFFINKNSDLLSLLALAVLRGGQASLLAYLFYPTQRALKISFYKKILYFYLVYILIGFLFYGFLKSATFWGFAFICLALFINIFFFLRLRKKEKKREEFRDVAFY